MDGITRKNSGVSIGDKVVVRKAFVKQASMVKLAPSNFSISVDPGFVSYVKKRLKEFPPSGRRYGPYTRARSSYSIYRSTS